jgi:glutamate dehydrogenase/leucine dehydrogenase/CBS domain-containing protein
MIPKRMHAFLQSRLPEKTLSNRLVREAGRAFMEFGPLDVERLTALGIQVDSLGPTLVVCLWDETSDLEIGGYLIVDNLAMGRPSMGGIRMLPEVTPGEIHNLARGMTLKNAAADLPYGGGKAGIVAEGRLSPEDHTRVVRGFARLIHRYREIYLPGPDVGTDDADMRTIAIENGLDNALSKPAEMGGNRIDELGAAAGGTIIALEELTRLMPRLQVLPQFATSDVPAGQDITLLIQGFGAVGAHAAKIACERIPGVRIIGISDEQGYVFDEAGLPVDELFNSWQSERLVTLSHFERWREGGDGKRSPLKYSSQPNDLLRESAFCLIPAAPIATYLGVEPDPATCMTVDRMGRWRVIVEGANTYSPAPARKQARARMERAVYRERGVLIATDYLVNSGGVVFAAQERLIKTPDELRIPSEILGNDEAVDRWLTAHASGLEELADRRRTAAVAYRDEVIRRNMRELVDLLANDADLLPCEAAERISVRRIASSERDRTVGEIMEPIPTARVGDTIQQAASLLVEGGSPIVAVLSGEGALAGVVTEWDFTRATSTAVGVEAQVSQIMSTNVISAAPEETILEVVRKLEYHEISAMPVVERGCVMGMVCSDLLARRSLLRLLQSPTG